VPDLARMIQNRDEIPEESLRFAETRHRVPRETLKAWSVSWDAEDGTFVFPRWAPDGLLEVVTKRAYREELMPNGCHWMDLPDCVPDPKRSLYGSHNVDLTSRRAIVAEGTGTPCIFARSVIGMLWVLSVEPSRPFKQLGWPIAVTV